MSLRDRIATPDGKRQYVRALFATIADRYDFITMALSYGRDRRWKKQLVELTSAGPGTHALDLATGTGDIAFALTARGASVVGLDITHRMIELAVLKRRSGPSPRFIVGDMMGLPIVPGRFDVVTTGYGLRNVPSLDTALAEIFRVLKPGGRLLSLDFNRPSNALVRMVYLGYLTTVGSALGWALHGDPDTYRYIPASLRNYLGADRVNQMMESQGFVQVRYQPVLAGLMAIHEGMKPSYRTHNSELH